MGLTRTGKHKKLNTGGKRAGRMIKKLHSIARQSSNTKIGETKVKRLRVRGGNYKMRALRLNSGSFTLRTHSISFKTAIQQVVYHASNNELVRTNTLTKGCVVKIDPTPFSQAIEEILKNEEDIEEIDPKFVEEFKLGNIYGIITSRPGQAGTADGHILQAKELLFYFDKLKTKQKK
ncbi:small subunit ribosomal protein S8e [Nematocida sp. LUAm3]|nr:small subunit ribosomal protein S8e [Nematocida sp. LUAm3]KAI5175182.1 small subunit ribosomal protein S8e [Nematocida sp. LUAm2]KAI5178146.1 small subunit ribosomal protein S8e [Nematocida sp. LUAm1]